MMRGASTQRAHDAERLAAGVQRDDVVAAFEMRAQARVRSGPKTPVAWASSMTSMAS